MTTWQEALVALLLLIVYALLGKAEAPANTATRQPKRKFDEKKNWKEIKTDRGEYKYNPEPFCNGGYGTIHMAVCMEAKVEVSVPVGKDIVVKKISRSNPNLERLKKDGHELLELDHPNVVKMYDFHVTKDFIYIFMEYCANGDLLTYLKGKQLTHKELLQQILIPCDEGLTYLHAENVIHRDIKPLNILVDENGCVKLADYDFSRVLGVDDSSTMKSSVGTKNFMAPEMGQGKKYKRGVDIYALGKTFGRVISKIEKKGNRENPVHLSWMLEQIYTQMAQEKPEDRPTAAQVLLKLKRVLEQEENVKLVKSTTWKVTNLYTPMCVTMDKQWVTCIRDGRNHHITVHNKENGTVIKQISFEYLDVGCRIIGHPVDPNCILHVHGGEISTINLDQRQEVARYNFCPCNNVNECTTCSGSESAAVCKGPAGTVLVLGRIRESECRIVQVQWQMATASEVKSVGPVLFDWMPRSMCYVELHDILVCTFERQVFGIKLSDGSLAWKLSGAVVGRDIVGYASCCDPDGRVYLGDYMSRRILVVDGKSGAVLQVLLEGFLHGSNLADIWWSDISPQPQLFVHYSTTGVKVSSFTVTTGQQM